MLAKKPQVSLAMASAATLVLLLSDSWQRQAEAEPPVFHPAPPEPPRDSVTLKVERGEHYRDMVKNVCRLGLDEVEAELLQASLFEYFRAKLYPGQEYRAVFRGKGIERVLESFQLRDRHEPVRYVLRREEKQVGRLRIADLDYSEEPVPIRVDTVALSGVLTTSLYDAFQAMGEHPSLVQKMMDVFAWDIDFFRDPRLGDAILLLVEKQFDDMDHFIGYGNILTAQYRNKGHDFTGIYYDGGYYDREGKSMEKMLLKAPLNFTRISSGFSRSRLHPILGVRRPHWGVDYVAAPGTPIFAAGDGVVEYSKWVGGYGKTVKVRHNGVYCTYYAHLKGYAKGVCAGKRVKQGEVIGYLGSTGLSTGPHLDYRVEKHGEYVNPTTLKMEAGEGIAPEEREAFLAFRDRLWDRMLTGEVPPGNRLAANPRASGSMN